MINTANNKAWLKDFDVAREGVGILEVRHLQYASDNLNFL